MRRLSTDVNGRLGGQVVAAFRAEPLEVLRYVWRSCLLIGLFIANGPGPGLFWRLRLLAQFAYIHLKVPGGVTLPEMLFLIEGVCAAPTAGLMVEVGSWKGLSAVCFSIVAHARGQKFVAVDTFSGLPQTEGPFHVATSPERSYVFEEGAYCGTHEEFWSNVRRYGRPEVVSTVRGDVCQLKTLGLPEGCSISYAFIDVDLPTAYRGALRLLAPHISASTRIHLHEGLLDPVLQLARDEKFWSDLGIRPPVVELLQTSRKLRTLLVELRFSGPGDAGYSA